MVEQQSGLTLGRVGRILRRSWIVILVLAVIGLGGAYLVSAAETPVYKANASVYFSLTQGATSSDLNQGSAYTQAQMLSFAQLATSSITLNRVIDDLNLPITSKSLARNLDVTIPQNTVILDISASSTSGVRAARIANSVAANLSTVVIDLAPAVKGSTAAVSARVIEPAVAPTTQSSPSKVRDAATGGILGLLIGAVGSILFALLDTRLRSVEALASVTDLPLLGQIARSQKSNDRRPIMVRNPNGPEAESFRRVRAGLRFASIDKDVHVILVTSALPAEGKTTLSIDLSLAIAETGARVLLIDADFRRPRVAERLSAEGAVGLTTVLVGGVSLEDARRRYGSASLDLLLSGEVPPNPSELLSSTKMAQVLGELSVEYDVVIVDTAPVLSVADATLLAPHVDLTLLVVDASKSRKAQLTRAIRALEGAGSHISGIVLNRVKVSQRRDAYYYDMPSDAGESRVSWFLGKIRSSADGVTLAGGAEPPLDIALDEAVGAARGDSPTVATEAVTEPEPVVEPDSVSEPEAPVESAPESEPEPVSEPEAPVESESEPEPVSETQAKVLTQPTRKPRRRPRVNVTTPPASADFTEEREREGE
jgi:capsular exopolysaccharide synthesis family protein